MQKQNDFRDAARFPWAMAVLGVFTLGAFMMISPPAIAQELGDEDFSLIWDVARGGQLYDNWPEALDQKPPSATHPSYPLTAKARGPATWRCKECHGWDYKGEDGVYGKGEHKTGIKGIRRVIGADPKEIEKIIRNETHAYTPEMLPDKAVRKLALFVSMGQINMDQYINRQTREVLGNLDRGALFYQTVCVICHGYDGARMTFHKEETALAAFEDPGYMGTLANRNPWEVLHKIRNGQPGVGMVALRMLSIQDQVDVLSYLQTLPRKKPKRR